MKVTAYRCDVCGSLNADEPPYYFDDVGDFQVKSYQNRWGSDPCACGSDCLKAALDAWIAKKNQPEESEPIEPEPSAERTIKFEGVQPS